jgi:hypothetical protein
MLVDFLKGNHFTSDIATVPWLWVAPRLGKCGPSNCPQGIKVFNPQVRMGAVPMHLSALVKLAPRSPMLNVQTSYPRT